MRMSNESLVMSDDFICITKSVKWSIVEWCSDYSLAQRVLNPLHNRVSVITTVGQTEKPITLFNHLGGYG